MKRKHIIILAASIVALLFAVTALLTPHQSGDVSKIRIGFAGYGVVDGKHSLILVVTNGSSYRISQPDGRCELRGESSDSMTMSSRGMHTIACGFGTPKWGWWQLQLPKIPSVAPGATFQFAIPVDHRPYTWHVTVPFTTIPFRDRLPYALRSRWPSSERDAPNSFEISPPPIPPAPSQVSTTVSAVDSIGAHQ